MTASPELAELRDTVRRFLDARSPLAEVRRVMETPTGYDADVWSRYGPALQPFVDGGWLIYDGGTLRLSRAGMLVAHDIMTVFLA